MKIRSLAGWALGALVITMSTAATGLAWVKPLLKPSLTPEDPTMVLVALGGAGVAWQYFRTRVRK